MKEAILEPLKQVLELSPKEQLEFMEAFWDAVSAEKIPLSEAEKKLLDERLEEAGEGFTWEQVKERHQGKP